MPAQPARADPPPATTPPVPVAVERPAASEPPARPEREQLAFLEVMLTKCADPSLLWLPLLRKTSALTHLEAGAGGEGELWALERLLEHADAQVWSSQADACPNLRTLLDAANPPEPACGSAFYGAARAAEESYQKLVRLEREAAEAEDKGSRLLLDPDGSPGRERRVPEARSPVRQRREDHYPGMHVLSVIAAERAVLPAGVVLLDESAKERVVYMPPLVATQPPRHLGIDSNSNAEEPPDLRMLRLLFRSSAASEDGLKALPYLETVATANGLSQNFDARRVARKAHTRSRSRLSTLQTEQAAADARRLAATLGGLASTPPLEQLDDVSGMFTMAEMEGVETEVLREMRKLGWPAVLRQPGSRPASGASSPASVSAVGAGGIFEIAEDERDRLAQEALLADEACEDQVLVRGLRYAILAQTAYRVPTGAEFHERLRKVRASGSSVSATDMLRKYRRDAESQLAKVRERLERLYVASGMKYRLLAQTTLELGSGLYHEEESPYADRPLSAERSPSRLSAGSGEGEDVPEVPPGWFVCSLRDSPSEVVVCVAGTQNTDDVFRDCMFIPVPFEVPFLEDGDDTILGQENAWQDVLVHKGFLDGATKLFHLIVPELLRLRQEFGNLRLHFTGHSLGGATAVLLACFFAVTAPEGLEVTSVYTYGAPNIFHVEKWEQMGKPTPPMLQGVDVQQFVNGRDIVPRALGSEAIMRVAKLAIRMGMRALSFVTPENAECLPAYRFVGPNLHHMDPSEPMTTHTQRDDQVRILSLKVSDMRPQAGLDHKQGNYIRRLLSYLDEKTGHSHMFSLETDPGQAGSPHPLMDIAFDKDGCSLSPELLAAADDIHRRFRRGGPPPADEPQSEVRSDAASQQQPPPTGLDETALLWILKWSERPYPAYFVPEKLLGGAYELLPQEEGEAPELSEKGWRQLLEGACYGDIEWVGRVLDATGWEVKGGAIVKAEGSEAALLTRESCAGPSPRQARVRLIDTATGGQSSAAMAGLQWLFGVCANPLPGQLYKHVLLEGWGQVKGWHPHPILRATSAAALYVALDSAASRVSDPAAAAAELRSSSLAAQEALSGLREEYEEGKARAKAKGVPPPLPDQSVLDSMGNVTLKGWLRMMAEYCRADEIRVWAALRGMGFSDELRPPAGGDWEWQRAAHDAHRDADVVVSDELERRQAMMARVLRYRLHLILRLREKERERTRAVSKGGFGVSGRLMVELDLPQQAARDVDLAIPEEEIDVPVVIR
eukprot:TRINITY_DN7460_c0_g3_i1.p1 TRINITY_DN7460_c0_g3~~TRINITY_DN7460_c0_g3_i1.p1  ORF type:complete len:1392 (+),score=504.92 TRINITY_DN7460_c0_g3_i1:445-4176(+)